MKIIESVKEMHEYCQQLKHDGKTIASLNTAGILHEGHMHLIDIAKKNADVVSLSIDRPIEFFEMKNEESVEKLLQYDEFYGDDNLKKDIDLCKIHNVDIFYNPSMSDLYGDMVTKITLSNPFVENVIPKCNSQVIAPENMMSYIKDFNIQMTDVTVLGQKDIHQTLSVISMIKDFNFPIKSIIAPIIRELDGIACSSRNRFLTPSERKDATSVYQTLHEISRWSSYPPVVEIKEHITNRLIAANGEIDFIQICCFKTLENLNLLDRKAIIIINAFFGETELGDNIIIEP